MATRNWNPSEPYALGLEWPGMRSLALPLTQEVEYGHTFQADATETIDTAAFEILGGTPSRSDRQTALVTVYRRDNNDIDEPGDELEWGTVNSTLCAVNGGAVTAPAALVNAATVTEALVTPSDYKSISFIAGGNVTLEFATAGLFTGKRILEIKLHFSAQSNNVLSPAATATIFLNVGATTTLADTVPIDGVDPSAAIYEPATVRVLSLGEVNYAAGTLPLCWPWTVTDVGLFDSTTEIQFLHPTGNDYYLHYAALEVVWCEENRTAVGAVLMGGNTAGGEEPMQPGRHVVNLRQPGGTDNWAKVGDDYYTTTVTSARSPGFGLISRGEAPFVPLVDSFATFVNHQGRVAPRLPSNVLGSADYDSRLAPIKFVTSGAAVASDFDPYDRSFGGQVFNGTYAAQDIEQRSGGGTVTYPWLRFYARIIGDPDDVTAIDITTPDGTMNYFAASLLALPEIFDGWRQVTLEWPAGQEPTIVNDSSNFNVQFSTTQGNNANRWEILGVSSYFLLIDAPTSGDPTYGQGDTQAAYAPDGIGAEAGDAYSDFVVTLHTAAPAVTGFDSALAATDLGVTEYQGETACRPTEFGSPVLTWTSSTLAGADFGYYELQRADTFDPTWRTIAQLTSVAAESFTDVEARVGVASSHRMRIVRADGIEGAWTATETQTVPSVPNPCGTLYFSSNSEATRLLAYAEVFDGPPVEDFGFVEAGSVVQQRMYGRYGTQSFHPTERGGVAFDRNIVVNALAAPLLGRTNADQYAAVVVDDAPSAYYRLDDEGPTAVADDMGNAPGVGTDVGFGAPGVFVDDRAASFNGGTSVVTIADTGFMRYTTDLTIEGWVKKDTAANGSLFYKDETAVGESYSLFFDANVPHFRIIDTANVAHDLTGGLVTPGEWAHVVATYAGGGMRLFVNGVQVATNLGLGVTIREGVGDAFIGSQDAFPAYWLNGDADHVAVYGYALSATQITHHYGLLAPFAATADKAFTLLRDLAWADVPYVCVKDDLGNRWFATLIVPNGSMQRSPQLFIANVQVIESTEVPYPVTAQT